MITIIVGNRPQFVKLAPIVAALDGNQIAYEIIHSGQHYDDDMSGRFFSELSLPNPMLHLAVTKNLHGAMTAEMLVGIESALIDRQTKGVIVFGDTNTTLAGALAAAKLNIPVAHIEAGPRTSAHHAPEEINRRVVDHLSTLCFCPDTASLDNLRKEGLGNKAHWVGDVMLDAYRMFAREATTNLEPVITDFAKSVGAFDLLTIHRAHNTESKAALQNLAEFIESSPHPLLFPVHPRTAAALSALDLLAPLKKLAHVRVTKPLSYLQTLGALNLCSRVLTDSGGLQKEGFFAGKQSIVFDGNAPWPELAAANWIANVGGFDKHSAAELQSKIDLHPSPLPIEASFGNGNAAQLIVEKLREEGWFSHGQ
jgi:UDP-GlcNAc3NAcA epimerase